MIQNIKPVLVLLSLCWLSSSHAATTKHTRHTSRGRRVGLISVITNTTPLSNSAPAHDSTLDTTQDTLNGRLTVLPKSGSLEPVTLRADARNDGPNVAPKSGSGSVEPPVLRASLDASQKLAKLEGSGTTAPLEDSKGSNSSRLKSREGAQDLQPAGSELLRIEARSLESHSTDYHRPIYDYNDHGSYKDSSDVSNDYPRRDGYDHPYKGSSSDYHHDDHGHSTNYDYGHDIEHSHDTAQEHSGTKGHHDEQYQAHDTNHDEGGHSHGGDFVSGHDDDGSYRGGHTSSAVSEAGHDAGSHGHHNKGHSEDGFDTVHHKEEYGYSETFGDDEDLTKYHDSQDHFDDFHTSDEGKNFFGSSFMDDHGHDHFGSSGDHARGSYHDQHDDTSSSFGHEGDFDFKSSFGGHDSSSHDDHHDTPAHYTTDFDHLRSSYDEHHPDHVSHLYDDNHPYDNDHHDHIDRLPYDDHHSSVPYDDHHSSVPYDDQYPHNTAQASIDAKFDSIIPYSFSSVDPGLYHDVPTVEVGLYESAVGDYGLHDPLFRGDVKGSATHYSS